VTDDWFADWFGEEYIALYPHRDEREATAAVDLFLRRARPPAGGRVLDLACGAGRHLRVLRERGLRAVGLDLSAALLRRARSVAADLPLARGDMRTLPFAGGSLDAVTSFFTSFGYFSEPEEDRKVLQETRRVLSTRGALLIDYLNAPAVRRDLVEEDTRIVNGREIRQRRRIEDDAVIKEIEILSGGDGPVTRFVERVRLYEDEAITDLLSEAGFEVENRFGEYGGEPHSSASSRLILLARAR